MRTRDEFFRIMEQQTEIALATSADNVPNVRIVNFILTLRVRFYISQHLRVTIK